MKWPAGPAEVKTKVEIAFNDKELRRLCESRTAAEQKFGKAVFTALKNRLADICAADTINDLPAGKPYTREGGNQSEMVLPIHDGVGLVFCPNHRKPSLLSTGEIDWQMVSRIKILRIGNIG